MLALGFLLLPVAGAISATQQGANYSVAALSHDFVADTPVGPKKAGLACLPNGKVRWGDLDPGANADLRARLANKLRSAGLRIDAPNGAGRVLHVRILALRVSACAKKFGLGRPGSLSGKGTIDIEWTVEGTSVSQSSSFMTHADFTFTPSGDNHVTIIDAAFEKSARMVAPQLM
jgi:hypothetical protein